MFRQDNLFDCSIPRMPESYAGKVNKSGGYTKTNPRVWTEQEIKWLTDMKRKGYNAAQIAESMDRSHTSVAIKIKRLGKSSGTYNDRHIREKYRINDRFVKAIDPASVLDAYCGSKDFYSAYDCERVTNDKNAEFEAGYHMDALAFMCRMYSEGRSFDLVDLDPFGSAYDSFDLAVKMARKGLCITLGELGHKRWKRLDFVSRYYGIDSLEDFTIDNLVEHIQSIGRRNKKDLVVFDCKEWRNIGRVWFEVKPLKITSQWENKEIGENEGA